MKPGAPSPRARFTVVSVRPHEATVDARTRAQRDLAKLRALLVEKLAANPVTTAVPRPTPDAVPGVGRVRLLGSSRRAGRAWPASSRTRSRSYVRA